MHLPLPAAKPRGQAVQRAPRARLRTAARGGDARALSVRYNTHTTRTARRAHGRAALTAAEALLHAAQSGLGGSLQHSGGALHGRPSASTAARPGGAEETGLQLSTAARRSGAVLCCAAPSNDGMARRTTARRTMARHGAPRHGAPWHGTARHGMARRTSSRVTSRLNLSCTEASTYTVCSRCTGYNRMHTCTHTHTHIQMYFYI